MRLKARSKIQKYTPDSDANADMNFADERFQSQLDGENHKQIEENMLVFEIFVESLQMDLKRILNSNSFFKVNTPDFNNRKEVLVNFIKTGKIQSEANDIVSILYEIKTQSPWVFHPSLNSKNKNKLLHC